MGHKMKEKLNKAVTYIVGIFSAITIVIGGSFLIHAIKINAGDPIGNILAAVVAIPTIYWAFHFIVYFPYRK